MKHFGHNPKLFKFGDSPFLGAIDFLTIKNNSFRKVIYTGNNMQLVLMSLLPYEEIDGEIHKDTDQFFRLENGSVEIYIKNPNEVLLVEKDDAVIIPAGTYHKVVAGETGAKLYTIYSPPNHSYDKIEDTKPENSEDSE